MSALTTLRRPPVPEDLVMLKSILERIVFDNPRSAALELTRMAEAMVDASWLDQSSFDPGVLLEMGAALMRESQFIEPIGV